MIKFSEITCSYEQSLELKLLGYPQRGLFYWDEHKDSRGITRTVSPTYASEQPRFSYLAIAPTAEELIWFLSTISENKDLDIKVKGIYHYGRHITEVLFNMVIEKLKEGKRWK